MTACCIDRCGVAIHTSSRLRHNNSNNNNDAIWRGSVLTGEELPPHSGELNHALSQAGGPTQSQLSQPLSSGHHIFMEHQLRMKQLNSDTNASNKTYVQERQEKRKEETFFLEKRMKNGKEKKKKKKGKHFFFKTRKKEKRAQRGTSRDGSTNFFCVTRNLEAIEAKKIRISSNPEKKKKT